MEVVWRSQRMARSSFYRARGQWIRANHQGGAKRGETHLYTTAVIRDLQQLQATFLGKYLERCRAGVHGILHELLQSMHRGDDNLASSNLVDDIRVQGLDWVPVSNEH